MRVEIKGDIITNDDAWIYDWLGWEYASPEKVSKAIKEADKDETIDVYIKSPGGYVTAGQDIYSMLRNDKRTRIHIDGMACSAASIIAMSGQSDISPVGMLMIHNVQGGADGDYHDLEKMADILQTMNGALAQAYEEKTGMSHDEVLKLMDEETWLTANDAVAYGFIDDISKPASANVNAVNAYGGVRLTDDIRQKVLAEKKAADEAERLRAETVSNLLDNLDDFGI